MKQELFEALMQKRVGNDLLKKLVDLPQRTKSTRR